MPCSLRTALFSLALLACGSDPSTSNVDAGSAPDDPLSDAGGLGLVQVEGEEPLAVVSSQCSAANGHYLLAVETTSFGVGLSLSFDMQPALGSFSVVDLYAPWEQSAAKLTLFHNGTLFDSYGGGSVEHELREGAHWFRVVGAEVQADHANGDSGMRTTVDARFACDNFE